ncbi:MAG: hypothetical protein IPM34_13350 [Saprospiraceae bacterium]|nr:hypothetical protein [Saprospiraceae bacterium]
MNVNIAFKNQFKQEPLMTYKAPGRVNIIGEHTDYNAGFCLPAAIDQSVFFALSASNETRIHSFNQNDSWYPGQTKNQPDWAVYFNGVLQLLKEKGYSWPYFNLGFGGDLVIGAGLSSSSALTCGFISILDEFSSWNLSIEQLTKFAVQAEKASGVDGGMMDHISIMHGKKDHALCIDCMDWSFQYIPVVMDHYKWLVADTKVKHHLIHTDYNSRSAACKKLNEIIHSIYPDKYFISQLSFSELQQLKSQISPRQFEMAFFILEENIRVQNMAIALQEHNTNLACSILFDGHEGLRSLYKVSCQELDFMVNFSKYSGLQTGARMVGGGFGGCTLHLVPSPMINSYSSGLSNAFKNKFGYEPHCFEAQFGDGVKRLE